MTRIASTTTLLPLSAVAEAADVTRQTVYNWLNAGILARPRFDVAGSPVFTREERDGVVQVAKERRALLAEVRLPKRQSSSEK